MEDDIIELQRAIANDVNRIAARTWNNDEFFRFSQMMSYRLCRFNIENINDISFVERQISIIQNLNVLLPQFSAVIRDSLGHQNEVNLWSLDQQFLFRITDLPT